MFQDLVNCRQILEELSIFNLPISDNNIPEIEFSLQIMNSVHHSSKIQDYNNNWSQLCFLEVFCIKTLRPQINMGFKDNNLAYIGAQNQWPASKCVTTNFSCEKSMIFHNGRKFCALPNQSKGILCRADPNPEPDLQKKRTQTFWKSGPYIKIHCMS